MESSKNSLDNAATENKKRSTAPMDLSGDKRVHPTPKRHRQQHPCDEAQQSPKTKNVPPQLPPAPNNHPPLKIETRRSVLATPDEHSSLSCLSAACGVKNCVKDGVKIDSAHPPNNNNMVDDKGQMVAVKRENNDETKISATTTMGAAATNHQCRLMNRSTTSALERETKRQLTAQQEEYEKKLDEKDTELAQQAMKNGELVQRIAELEQQLATQREEYEKNLDAKEVELVQQVMKNGKLALCVTELEAQLALQQDQGRTHQETTTSGETTKQQNQQQQSKQSDATTNAAGELHKEELASQQNKNKGQLAGPKETQETQTHLNLSWHSAERAGGYSSNDPKKPAVHSAPSSLPQPPPIKDPQLATTWALLNYHHLHRVIPLDESHRNGPYEIRGIKPETLRCVGCGHYRETCPNFNAFHVAAAASDGKTSMVYCSVPKSARSRRFPNLTGPPVPYRTCYCLKECVLACLHSINSSES